MILREVTDLDAPPGAVFRFFEEMEDNYLAMHPDHVLFRWEDSGGLRTGVVFYFEEYIAEKLLKKRVRFTRIEPYQHIEFVPTNWLMRLFLPRILFAVAPLQVGCRLTAEIHLRMGPIAAWLHRREFAAVRNHMRLEGENIARILKGGAEERERLRQQNRRQPSSG